MAGVCGGHHEYCAFPWSCRHPVRIGDPARRPDGGVLSPRTGDFFARQRQ